MHGGWDWKRGVGEDGGTGGEDGGGGEVGGVGLGGGTSTLKGPCHSGSHYRWTTTLMSHRERRRARDGRKRGGEWMEKEKQTRCKKRNQDALKTSLSNISGACCLSSVSLPPRPTPQPRCFHHFRPCSCCCFHLFIQPSIIQIKKTLDIFTGCIWCLVSL